MLHRTFKVFSLALAAGTLVSCWSYQKADEQGASKEASEEASLRSALSDFLFGKMGQTGRSSNQQQVCTMVQDDSAPSSSEAINDCIADPANDSITLQLCEHKGSWTVETYIVEKNAVPAGSCLLLDCFRTDAVILSAGGSDDALVKRKSKDANDRLVTQSGFDYGWSCSGHQNVFPEPPTPEPEPILFPDLCTDQAAAGLHVIVVEKTSGAEISNANIVVTSGSFSENLEQETYCTGVVLPANVGDNTTHCLQTNSYFGLYERAGTFNVSIKADGYVSAVVKEVKIDKDTCHVITKRLDVELEKVSAKK